VGVQGYFANFSSTLEDAFRKVNIPVIGDQLVDGLKPFFDSLSTFRTDLHDFLQDVLALGDTPGGPSLPELFQNAVYLALGPGAAGLDDPRISAAVRDRVAPLGVKLQKLGLGLLQDGPDFDPPGESKVGPSDVLVTMGEDDQNTRWLEFNVHL